MCKTAHIVVKTIIEIFYKENVFLLNIDNRRISERDSKASMNAHGQQLPNSKSVSALHHVGNSKSI